MKTTRWVVVGLALTVAVLLLCMGWDLPLAGWAAAHPSPRFGLFMERWGRSAATPLIVASAYVLVEAKTRRGHPLPAQLAAATLSGLLIHTAVITNGLKLLMGRTRPMHLVEGPYTEWYQLNPSLGDFSFPSGHVAVAMVLVPAALVLWRSGRRGAGVAMLLLSLIWAGVMAWGRIRHGAHFLTDTLASIGLGLTLAPLALYPWRWTHRGESQS